MQFAKKMAQTRLIPPHTRWLFARSVTMSPPSFLSNRITITAGFEAKPLLFTTVTDSRLLDCNQSVKWIIFIISLFIITFDNNSVAQSVFTSNDPASTITSERFDESLLVKTLYRFTNNARKKNNIPIFTWNDTLAFTAHDHSLDMVSFQFLSHISPDKNNQTLQQRLKNHGFLLTHHKIAENIGVDYILDIAGKPYYKKNNGLKNPLYINHKTGEPIQAQTYEQFARDMVDQWLASPGHRKNILNPGLTHIGIGAIHGQYQNFNAIYVTQIFMGMLDTKIHKCTLKSKSTNSIVIE